MTILHILPTQEKPIKILFFGDSITEMGVKDKGYIDLFNGKLKNTRQTEKYQLIGSGIGGNKVYDLFFRMESDVLNKQPDIVVIWIGVNDVWHKSMFGTGTDMDKFERMYADILQRLQQKGIKVFCCTPACIGEKTDHSNAQDGDLNEFSKIIRKTASANGAGLIDFRKAFIDYNLIHNTDNKKQGILTYDGVHLNDTGNQVVADMMWDTMMKK
jgi:lysophospholipase L1-like esterase